MNNLGLDRALDVVRRAVEKAKSDGHAVVAVVVDRGGAVVASARMDGVGYALFDLARRKAATSAMFAAPLSSLTDFMAKDPLIHAALNTSPDILLLPGAVPIMEGSECVGGLGVAGGHYTQDQALADAATS